MHLSPGTFPVAYFWVTIKLPPNKEKSASKTILSQNCMGLFRLSLQKGKVRWTSSRFDYLCIVETIDVLAIWRRSVECDHSCCNTMC